MSDFTGVIGSANSQPGWLQPGGSAYEVPDALFSGSGSLATVQLPWPKGGTAALSGSGTLVSAPWSATYIRNIGVGSLTSVGATVSCSAVASAPVPVQRTLICWLACDNLGYNQPTVTGISKPVNETAQWVHLVSQDAIPSDPGMACVAEMWAIKTKVAWPVGTVITATYSDAATVVKTIIVDEYSYVSTSAKSTGAYPSSTLTSWSCSTSGHLALAAGDLVLGGANQAWNTPLSDDTDTLKGAWSTSTRVAGIVGTDTSVSSQLQHKIVLAIGAQTFNSPGAGGAYQGGAIVALKMSEDHGGVCVLSGSGTLTLSGVPSITGTVTLNGSGTVTAVGFIGAAALSGGGILTTTQIPAITGAATLSGSGALAFVGTPALPSTEMLSGEGTLGVSGVAAITGATALGGSGTLGATGIPEIPGAATLSGNGLLTTTQIPAITSTVSLSGDSDLDIDASSAFAADADDFDGEGTLAVGGVPAVIGTAALGGEGYLDVSGATFGTADLAGSGALATTETPSATIEVALSGSGQLGAVGVEHHQGATALDGSGVLDATGQPHPRSPVGLSGGGSLTLTAILTTTQPLVLSGSGVLMAGGTLFTQGTVALSGSGLLAAVGHLPPPVVDFTGWPQGREWGGLSPQGTRGGGGSDERDWWGESLRQEEAGTSQGRTLVGSGTLTVSGVASGSSASRAWAGTSLRGERGGTPAGRNWRGESQRRNGGGSSEDRDWEGDT